MKAYEIIFKSGVARTIYTDKSDTATDGIIDQNEIVMVLDVLKNLKNEKEFRQEHASILKASAVLHSIQKMEAERDLYSMAQSKHLIKGPGGLALPV